MRKTIELVKTYGLRKYLRMRKYYNLKKKGKVCDSFIKISMYYFPEDVGTIERKEMESGKIGIFEIISVTSIDDFGSKNIKKDFMGYENEKYIRECTLGEFMLLYHKSVK